MRRYRHEIEREMRDVAAGHRSAGDVARFVDGGFERERSTERMAEEVADGRMQPREAARRLDDEFRAEERRREEREHEEAARAEWERQQHEEWEDQEAAEEWEANEQAHDDAREEARE